jgi:hypothetical protein
VIQVIAGAGFLPTQSFVLHNDGTAGAFAQDEVTIVSSASRLSIYLCTMMVPQAPLLQFCFTYYRSNSFVRVWVVRAQVSKNYTVMAYGNQCLSLCAAK